VKGEPWDEKYESQHDVGNAHDVPPIDATPQSRFEKQGRERIASTGKERSKNHPGSLPYLSNP
jgi:hypothetical protein